MIGGRFFRQRFKNFPELIPEGAEFAFWKAELPNG